MIIEILKPKFVKKANMFYLTWFESGAKKVNQKQKWFMLLEQAEKESSLLLSKSDETDKD